MGKANSFMQLSVPAIKFYWYKYDVKHQNN